MAETAPTEPTRRPALQGAATLHFLTTLLYAAFAIPVTVIALGKAWPAGVGLAVFFAVFWPKLPKALRRGVPEAAPAHVAPASVAPEPPGPGLRPSGNASFDAYRVEMLDRLEQEQAKFEGFLDRLREAKDKTEFDTFMDQRTRAERTGRRDAPEPA